MSGVCSIVLAAGEGSRMKSNMPKVLSKVLFKPMLKWTLDALNMANINKICVVTGYKSEIVIEYLKSISSDCQTVFQKDRKGTAHAVITAKDFLLSNIDKDVLILNGDSPFIDAKTINFAYNLHTAQKNAATVISAKISNPFGYGRIIRDSHTGTLSNIIEQKDANESVQKINEVNSGAYWFSVKALLKVLHNITNNNAQGEFYLPDTIGLLLSQKFSVNAYISESEDTVLGANTPAQLSGLNNIARANILNKLMNNGVDIPCKDGIIVTDDAKIGQNTCLLPGTIIRGDTVIGTNCIIGPNSYIDNCLINNNIVLNFVYCANSKIINSNFIKPFTTIKNNEIM